MTYAVPTPDMLQAFYPAFATTPVDTIALYIARVTGSDVDESWAERDYAPAIMAAAAHRMARAGVLASGGGSDAAGVTSFRSGSFSVQFSEAAAKQQVDGGWGSTAFGQDYLELLRRNRGGVRVTGSGAPIVSACDPFGPGHPFA